MNRFHPHWNSPRQGPRQAAATMVLGLAFLVPGVILLLGNLGLVSAAELVPYWPLLLVAVGSSFLLRPSASRGTVPGVLLVGAGTLLLLGELTPVDVALADLWPLLLVAAGAAMLTRQRRHERLAGCIRRRSDRWPAA